MEFLQLGDVLQPSAYMMLAGAVVFGLWAAHLRRQDKEGRRWKEIGWVAFFCIFAAGAMLTLGRFSYELPLPARLVIAAAILLLYGLFLKARQKK